MARGQQLHLPGMGNIEVRGPSSDTEALLNALHSLYQVLMGISNQLDLLVRLECGQLKRAVLRSNLDQIAAARVQDGQITMTEIEKKGQDAQDREDVELDGAERFSRGIPIDLSDLDAID